MFCRKFLPFFCCKCKLILFILQKFRSFLQGNMGFLITYICFWYFLTSTLYGDGFFIGLVEFWKCLCIRPMSFAFAKGVFVLCNYCGVVWFAISKFGGGIISWFWELHFVSYLLLSSWFHFSKWKWSFSHQNTENFMFLGNYFILYIPLANTISERY